jgi:glycosyltransferase involved in cell wall biosynthesis
MVLVEAMASGCAIISTIDLDYEGIKVKPFDTEAMIQAVGRLWDDRGLTAEIGKTNVARAKNITWERYAETLQSTYMELLATGEQKY